jgi:hypothetical protein
MRFHLGTHEPSWLARVDVPLFVSRRRLARLKRLPRAKGPWSLDSGGFSELSLYGRWRTLATEYASEVRRWRDEVGNLQWAASMDWMCEPFILEKTGLTVAEHQRQTVANYLLLRQLAPDLPWVPVLQGWLHEDYCRHVGDFKRAGVDLAALPLVGLGSVCRRQDTGMVEQLIRQLHGQGIRLHGFGFKQKGLDRVSPWLASADSLAWSFQARKRPPLPGHTHSSCNNCLEYALLWRSRVLQSAERGRPGRAQRLLFD